jgi:hypothetical protein
MKKFQIAIWQKNDNTLADSRMQAIDLARTHDFSRRFTNIWSILLTRFCVAT